MKSNQKKFTKQLEHACRLTGAVWGCYFYFLGDDWEIVSYTGLNDGMANQLEELVNTARIQKWLSSAVRSGKQKYRGLNKDSQSFDADRIYVFPSNHDSQILIIGADQLSLEDRDFFRTLTREFPTYLPSILRSQFPPKTGEGPLRVSTEIQTELNRVLELASEAVGCEFAVLAIRSGNEFDVYAVRNLNHNWVGMKFSLDQHPIIQESVKNKRALNLGINFPIQESKTAKLNVKAFWNLAPLVMSQQVIGLILFGRSEQFSSAELKTAEAIGTHAASSVEKSIVSAESANYLQRFALLNDLAQLASSGFDLYEVVNRVETMLSRTFGSDSSRVWLLDQDEQQFLEHPEGNPELAFKRRINVDDTIEGSVIESGRVLRIAEINKWSKFITHDYKAASKLVSPMRFRGEVTGVLSLESRVPDTFTEHDENLLSVVGSQVASIVENIRLNLETHERASNLLLINEIVRDFLGLTKIPQISDRAARLIAEKFNWDMVLVMILDENLEEFVAEGVAGKAIVDIPKGFHFASNLGIPARVLETGESILLKDASSTSGYFPIPGWEPGSGVWVPCGMVKKCLG